MNTASNGMELDESRKHGERAGTRENAAHGCLKCEGVRWLR